MKKLRNRIILYILIIITFVILINVLKFEKTSTIGSSSEVVYPFVKEEENIKTKFIIPYNDFKSLGIKVATYMNNNIQGEINIKIYDVSNDDLIYDENQDISQFQDNQTYTIKIPTQKDSKGKEYLLDMTINKLEDGFNLGIYGYKVDDDKVEVGLEYKFKGIEQGLYYYIIYFIGFVLVIESLLNFNNKGGLKNNEVIRKTRKSKNKN